VNAFFLTGIDNALPPDIASPFIIFCNDVRVSGEDGYNRIRAKPTAVVRIVDYLAILHGFIVAEFYYVSNHSFTRDGGLPIAAGAGRGIY
jgi:hypothetical protein